MSDFVTLQRGNTYKGALLGRPGPYLLGLACIQRNGGFKSDNLKTYGGDSDPRIIVGPGDLIVSLKDVTQAADLLGSVVRVPDHIKIGRLTQDTVKLVFKSDTSRDYIYWILRTAEARQHCRSLATGTTNLGLARADFLSFVVPPLTLERQHLLELLSALDDKIELNRRMNETLEASARALFRDWFVDFGPTRAKAEGRPPYLAPDIWSLFPDQMGNDGVPVGWGLGTFADVASAVNHKADPTDIDPDTPYIGLEHMPRRSIALHDWDGAGKVTSAKSVFTAGQILFGKLRPYFHKVGIAPVSGVCSTDIVVLQPRSPELSALALACASTDEFVAFSDQSSTGTKMPRTSWSIMKRFPLTQADKPINIAFEKLVGPMIETITKNIAESRTLAETRDALLPKLMSGEIRVRDAEAVVAECV
ncbi:MAG: restriction endonuclease subunit S [Blastomonas sp.]